MKKQRLIFAGLISALIMVGIFIYQRYRVAPALLLPEIQLSDLQGNSVKPASGKPTLLIFFGTWCRDCRKELPVLAKLESELKNRNIQVILVSDEEIAVLQDFSTGIPLSFQLCKLTGSFKENNIYTLPTSYLFCSNGSVFRKQTGAIEWTTELLSNFVNACEKPN
jgi:thiol-disulfide isomerase/thioredoxin